MAIYHLHTKIISRSKGKSSVGASAYRSGEKLHNKRDGLEHDYTRKKGVVYKEILAPINVLFLILILIIFIKIKNKK